MASDGNLDAALAQRRQVQAHDAEAVEEVLAEAAVADQGFEVGVGGGDDADVDAGGLRLADRMDLAGLEKAQQLGLDVEAGVADLVEEQRAAGGGADDALEVLDGAGEGAAAVAEQLRVEHVLRRRGAVEGQEGRRGAGRAGVNGAGEHLLAGAGFAGDEHRHVGRGDAARGGEEGLHFLGEEDGVALVLDRVGRPQRGAAALRLAGALELERVAAKAKDVAQEDGLERVLRRVAYQGKYFVAGVAQD